MRRYVIISFLLFVVSCSSQTGYHQAVFRDVKKADVRVMGTSLALGVPVDLCLEGDYLFVLAYTPDYWLHVYDKRTGEKKSSMLTVGRGPGEGMNLVSVDYKRDEQNLYAYDMVLRKTLVYHLDGSDGSATFLREIQLPAEGVVRKSHILPDGNYLYEGYLPGFDKNTRLILSDGNSVLDSYDEYPGVEDENDRSAMILGVSKADPMTGRFVCGTMFGAVLECFDLSGQMIRSTGIRLLDPPEMDPSSPGIQPKPGTKYGFSSFCLTDYLIFAVYVDGEDPNDFKTIATFDWKGKEQTMFVADWNILRICPGEGNGKSLYGIVSSPEMDFYLAGIVLQ